MRGATTWHRKIMAMRRFQSTLPVRGATYRHVPNHRPEPYFNPRSPCGERPPPWSCLSGQRTDFNPRSPCGERPDNWRGGLTWVGISIHAPRAGSDKCFPRPRVVQVGISIHAPRAGSDRGFHFCLEHSEHFNPRSPCGERQNIDKQPLFTDEFQSTLPVRGATLYGVML